MSAATTPLTIAVVKACCIGDCVMALPAIESLASAFPYAHIHAFVGAHSAPVFRASPHVSRVYITPNQLTPARVPGMAWNLRTAGHDWIVVLDRSRLLKAAARSAAPARLVTIPRAHGKQKHESDVYLDALLKVGVKASTSLPSLVPDDTSRAAADKVLAEIAKPFAVLQPGGAENPGTIMLDKRWPVQRYIEVGLELIARGMNVVLTGGPSDEEPCALVAAALGKDHCTLLAGKLDLMASTAVIERAVVYVGSDTGVSHLSAAVGTPSVVIFGPTNPDRYSPRGKYVRILAPERSRDLLEVDLRKPDDQASRPSTSEIEATAVIKEIDNLLQARLGSA